MSKHSKQPAKQPGKNPTSFRLSQTVLQLIGSLAGKMGISKAAVVEVAVREMANKDTSK